MFAFILRSCLLPLFVTPILCWVWLSSTNEWKSNPETEFKIYSPKFLDATSLLSRELHILSGPSHVPQEFQPRGDRALNHTLYKSILDAFDASGPDFLRSMRRRVARLPHRQVTVEDSASGRSRLHYVHIKRPASRTARCTASHSCQTFAIMLIHGWPGSFLEFFGEGDATQQASRDNSGPSEAEDIHSIGGFSQALLDHSHLQHFNVHLVVPSLPGYGFSQPLPAGQSAVHMARSLIALMHSLGYGLGGSAGSRGYYTQGGDWGGIIASLMARLDPHSTAGMHNNMAVPGVHLSSLAGLALAAVVPRKVLYTQDEARLRTVGVLPGTASHLLQLAYSTGYMHQQVTQPDTLATAVLGHDGGVGSNVTVNGLAAWMLEKLDGWSDCGWYQWLQEGGVQGGYSRDPARCLGLTRLMDAIALYASTGSFRSSLWVYHDTAVDGDFWGLMGAPTPPSLPVGVADMPGEVLLRFPLPALQRTYPGLVQFSRLPWGGHFAAWEAPGLLADDVAAFLDAVESGAAEVLPIKGAPSVPHAGLQGDEEL